jgi:transcriptional regulator NrdR family protein
VVDSRQTPAGVSVWRRRECQNCGRFTTYERAEVRATAIERAVINFVRALDTEEVTTS